MNICLVSTIGYPTRTQLGGVPTYTRTIAQALAREGHRVFVITHGADKTLTHEEDGPVHVYWAPMGNVHYYFARVFRRVGVWPRVLKAFEWGWTIRRILLWLDEEFGVDGVEYPNVWCEGLYHPRRFPMVIRMHTPLYVARPIPGCGDQPGWGTYERIEQSIVRRAELVSCHTPSIADLVAREYGVSHQKIVTIPNPVDIEHFKPMPKLSGQRPRIFHPGPRLDDWQKGTHVLLQAMDRVLETLPDAELYVAGRGELPTAGVSEQVLEATTVLGWLDHSSLATQYALADVTVVPSLNWDTFPNVCIESFASGTPVIASDIGGLSDVVTSGETGFLVPPGDPQALAGAILEVLSRPHRSVQMGRQARQKAETLYSLTAVAQQTVEAFGRITGPPQ